MASSSPYYKFQSSLFRQRQHSSWHLQKPCDQFSDYYRIFTDGSKVEDKVAQQLFIVRLPNNISIFRAELYALVLAIEVLRRSREQNFIIFSYSKSSLEAINNFQIEVDLVQKFICCCQPTSSWSPVCTSNRLRVAALTDQVRRACFLTHRSVCVERTSWRHPCHIRLCSFF